MDNQEKKKIFLEAVDKKLQSLNIQELEKYESLLGYGWKKRILRSIFAPRIVLNFKFRILKDKLFKKKNKKIEEFDYPFFYFLENLDALNELKSTKFLIKNFKDNDIFYDIGAQYGLYTSLALEFCKEVHAFEPIPKFFDVLKNNFKNYKNVFLNNLAVSDKKGKTGIYLGPTTIVEEMKKKYPKSCEEVEIETITLDEYIKTHSKPTIIKMDIEGAEFLAIKGGYEFFKNNSPIILMEVLGDEFLEISKKAVELLVELGYAPYQISLEGEISKVSLDFVYKLKGIINLVFFKKYI
ncbi:MAG: FkbM family methyltransferase [Minisyncoccia bacterium]|jgi:FkbM family methyltransferase